MELPDRNPRRGNTTSGPERRGNRQGRPGGYPQGTYTNLTSFKLSEEHLAIAVMLGAGTAAHGIRAVLSAVAPLLYSEIPADALGAKTVLREQGSLLRGDAARALGKLEEWVASVSAELKSTAPVPISAKNRTAASKSHKRKLRAPSLEEMRGVLAEIEKETPGIFDEQPEATGSSDWDDV